MTSDKFSFSKVLAWALYDFANTIFSAVVVTVYLPLYVTELTGKNAPLGIAATVSMITAGFLIPPLGALTDRTGKTKSYLFLTTLLCVGATAFLTFAESGLSLLAAFMLANLLFHASLVFYNSLLPVIAPAERQGFVSGLGTGLGYLGVLLSLPVAHVVDTHLGRRWVFLLAAVLFFLFALPLFLKVPERKLAIAQTPSLRKSFALLAGNRRLLYFLIANFFLLDALNTIILWLSVFLKKNFGLSQGTLIQTIFALNVSAFAFGLLLGKTTDRWGSKKTLFVSALSLGIVLLAVALVRSFAWVRLLILFFGGIAAAGIWTAGRKALIGLSPPERIGECFGIYGFTTKVSAIGSTTFSLLADLFGFRIAVLSQLVPVVLGLVFLSRTSDTATQ